MQSKLKAPKGRIRAVGVLAAAALLAAGCGLGGEAPSAGGDERAEPGSIKPVDALEGVKVAVGSKAFHEQEILGQISIAVLEAAGAEPVNKTGIAGTDATRKALLSGDIDLYWEYTGTTWVTHLQHDEQVTDADQLFDQVAKEDQEKNKVKWLKRSELNNTYAIAIREEKADELGVTKLSDLANVPAEELTFCLGQEFADRPDGFRPMLEAYDIKPQSVPSKNLHKMEDGLVYTEVDEGACNFGSVFTSNGEISAFGLRVLEDDKHFFPLYHAAVTVRQDFYQEYPEISEVFDPVTEKIDTEVLQELNGQAALDGKPYRQVARDWLKSEGFIK